MRTSEKTKMAAPASIQVVRSASFSAAHRYYNVQMSDSENRELYGSFYREKGFGHNFKIEFYFEGNVHPLTGMVVNLTTIDQWIAELIQPLDHRNLNQLPMFADVAPTPERIAQYLFLELDKTVKLELSRSDKNFKPGLKLSGSHDLKLKKIRLYEGESLWVDCTSA